MSRGKKWFIHTCRNKKCVNPEHIALMSIAEYRKFLGAIPTEDCPSSALTQEQADEIRVKYGTTPATRQNLSAEYDVSPGCIDHIVNGLTYGDEKIEPYPVKSLRKKKLSSADVLEIFRLRTDLGLRYDEIAPKYGITVSMVSRVLKGNRHRHAEELAEWERREALCATENPIEKNEPSETRSTQTS